ncbi:hypothetical protein DRP77_00735 [Candidatus Poribacteria bacterium]|nr:MAG: hypothetical protein DRP77_00735 [Candidatus Poribacteria bacterium]
MRLAFISLIILTASYLLLQIEAMSGVRRAIVEAVLKCIGVNWERSETAAPKEIRLSMEDEPPLLRGAPSRVKKAFQSETAPDKATFEISEAEGDIPSDPARISAFEPSGEPPAPEAETSLWELLEGVLPEDMPRPTDGDLTELFYGELEELMGIPEEIGELETEVDEEESCRELMRMLAPDLSEEEIDLILRLGGSGSSAGRASSDERGGPGL